MLTSCLCRSSDFIKPFYKEILTEIKENHDLHRKIWEYVMVAQALKERGCLAEGKRGLGFAVGTEPLPAYFAKLGVKVTATDLDITDERSKVWGDTNQLLTAVENLNNRGICPPDDFKKNVEYRAVDMNKIPEDLKDYDFNWSDCSFEHTGSIQSGLDFVLNQMKTLKDGGWAVHTTELNLTSNSNTIESGTTVLFRRKDIKWLINQLRSRGHLVERMNWKLDNTPADNLVDTPPYKQLPHLKINVGGYVTTSIMLIIQKNTLPKWRQLLKI